MNHTNHLLDAFLDAPNLINARRLVQHVNRHPAVFSLLDAGQELLVGNASRMVMAAARDAQQKALA